MSQPAQHRDDEDLVFAVLASGDQGQLEELAQLVEGFPHGIDAFIGRRRWITNAIDCGCRASVEWMLARRVDLCFRDDEGYTVLHSALERTDAEKYEMLTLLLEAGADVNARGINQWTPAHLAAARNDVRALEILVRFGADLSIRTEIDGFTTPLEDARFFGSADAVEYLEGVESKAMKLVGGRVR